MTSLNFQTKYKLGFLLAFIIVYGLASAGHLELSDFDLLHFQSYDWVAPNDRFLAEIPSYASEGRLKILKLAKKRDYLGRVDRELRTLRRIRAKPHSLLVRWFGVMDLKDQTYMVLEHLKGPSLKVWLSEAGAFDKILARFYSSCLLSALEHLHLIIGATHGDLHLGNIVLDKSGYAVLIDFGSSEEVKDGNSISYGTDIKDFGQCIFQMLTLQNQFICGWKPHATMLDDDTLKLLTQTASSSPSSSLKSIKKERFFWGINWTDLFMRRIKPPPLVKRELLSLSSEKIEV